MSDLDLSSNDDEVADLVDRYGYFSIQTGLFIHSHGVHGTGLLWLAILLQLGIGARMVATLLRESRAHGIHRTILAAVGKRLVVTSILAREVQSVAETFRA